jgi:hypothetical protein
MLQWGNAIDFIGLGSPSGNSTKTWARHINSFTSARSVMAVTLTGNWSPSFH